MAKPIRIIRQKTVWYGHRFGQKKRQQVTNAITNADMRVC
jgi:hypothetical protein